MTESLISKQRKKKDIYIPIDWISINHVKLNPHKTFKKKKDSSIVTLKKI